jgi:hypothetical protein
VKGAIVRSIKAMSVRERIAVVVMVVLIPLLTPMSQAPYLVPFALPFFTLLIVVVAGRGPIVYGMIAMTALTMSISIHGHIKHGIEETAWYEWLLAIPSLIVLNVVALGIAWPFHLLQKRRERDQ